MPALPHGFHQSGGLALRRLCVSPRAGVSSLADTGAWRLAARVCDAAWLRATRTTPRTMRRVPHQRWGVTCSPRERCAMKVVSKKLSAEIGTTRLTSAQERTVLKLKK